MLTEDVIHWQDVSVLILNGGGRCSIFHHDLTSFIGVIVQRCGLGCFLWYVQLITDCTHISDVANLPGL